MKGTIKTPMLSKEPELVTEFLPLLEEARIEEMDIRNRHIRDVTLVEEDLSKMEFFDVIFENCKAVNCNFERTSFVDVRFKNCDFSNCNFKDGYLKRCELIFCKWMGAHMQNSNWQHIRIAESNFKYAIFDSSKLDHICFSDSDISSANFSDCKLIDFYLAQAKVINTIFFKTSLKNVDFTDSEMLGISVSDEYKELKGAVVTPLQAADLAKLLGVMVK